LARRPERPPAGAPLSADQNYCGPEVIALVLLRDLPERVMTEGIKGVGQVIAREGLFFGIWWMYFKKSIRVSNTYPAAG
jgi:hypothetical protein